MTKPKTPTTEIEQRLVTVNEAAGFLGYKAANSVYKLIANGDLPIVDLGGRGGTRIDMRDLESYIDRNKRSA